MKEHVMSPAEEDATLRWLTREGRTPFQLITTALANKTKIGVLWELSRGTKRFKELERALSPVTAKVLTRNLRDLEAMSLIVRKSFEVSPPKVEYRLSSLGLALRPHIVALCHWTYDNADALARANL